MGLSHHLPCLFVLIIYVQVNNFSVMSGWVFLGWTSTKQRNKCFALGHIPMPPVSSNPQPLDLKVKHSTTKLLHSYYIWASMQQNLSSVFLTKPDSNQSPQLQRLARKLKFHLWQVLLSYFPKRDKQRRWSVCMDAQADLRLCCLQTPEKNRFSHIAAHICHQWRLRKDCHVKMPTTVDLSC